MLAMAIALQRHLARLENVTQTPRQVLRAYADENDYTTADIDAAIDWSIWDDDTPEDQDPVE